MRIMATAAAIGLVREERERWWQGRSVRRLRGDADGVLLWLAATADYGDRTGHVARGDEGGHGLMKVR